MRHLRAFTLIELILVILIISILAVSVVPKFFGSEQYFPCSLSRSISLVTTFISIKAMNQLDTCNRVMITDDYMVIEDNPELELAVLKPH